MLRVAIPLYPDFDSLDLLGPFQTFTFAGLDRYLVAADHNLVKSFEGVSIKPRATFADFHETAQPVNENLSSPSTQASIRILCEPIAAGPRQK